MVGPDFEISPEEVWDSIECEDVVEARMRNLVLPFYAFQVTYFILAILYEHSTYGTLEYEDEERYPEGTSWKWLIYRMKVIIPPPWEPHKKSTKHQQSLWLLIFYRIWQMGLLT